MNQPSVTENITPIEEYILALADDEHLMGQQHTEWIGVAPFLEEDLAMSSIGQDELGHAALLYEIILEMRSVEATDLAIDSLAYDRTADQYRSSHLVEFSTTDWAQALVRHWLYDTVEHLRWNLLAESSITALADVAVRVEREEVFHRLHVNTLLDALLASPDARPVVLGSLDSVLPYVANLLTPVSGESEVIAQGVTSGSIISIKGELEQAIVERFDRSVSVEVDDGTARQVRSDHFGPLMARMREVIDYDPLAVW